MECFYKTLLIIIVGLAVKIYANVDTSDSQEELVQVTTPRGILEGRYRDTPKNVRFASFENVPFAKPPIGELRFKDPSPFGNWEGVLNATSKGHYCPQLTMTGDYIGSEDCLVLNIYTPSLKPKKLLPVIVHISGGGFMMSSDTFYNSPNLFIDEDIILVMSSYRLGALGFASLGTADVPGNAGCKDQILALRWVKENIESFGGDPDLITAFGGSAGGLSVSLLETTEMAKGLLHGLISTSSPSISDFVVDRDSTTSIKALAVKLGLNSKSDDLLDQLRAQSVEDIIFKSGVVGQSLDAIDFPWRPTVESKFDNVEAFLTQPAEKNVENGIINNFHSIHGYDSHEAVSFYSTDYYSHMFKTERFLPRKWNITVGSKLHDDLIKRVKTFYFGDTEYDPTSETVDRETLLSAFDLLTDVMFFRDLDSFVRLLALKSTAPTFLYKFSYTGDILTFPAMKKLEIDGATHGDEFAFLFSELHLDENSRDYLTKQRLIKLYKNFALTGNPTPNKDDSLLPATWLPVTEQAMNYLDINDDLIPSTDPEGKRIAFWRELEEYFRKEQSRIKDEL